MKNPLHSKVNFQIKDSSYHAVILFKKQNSQSTFAESPLLCEEAISFCIPPSATQGNIFEGCCILHPRTQGCRALSRAVIIVDRCQRRAFKWRPYAACGDARAVKQFRVLPRNSILLALAIRLIGWSGGAVGLGCLTLLGRHDALRRTCCNLTIPQALVWAALCASFSV